jgi:ankyrin repeat protein
MKHIISFLDLETLGLISQTSKEMKDFVYNEKKDLRVETFIKNNTEHNTVSDLFKECCVRGTPLIVIKSFVNNKCIDGSILNDAFSDACDCGNLEVVELLLSDPRLDPCFKYNHVVRWASIKGDFELIKFLLSYKGSKDGCMWSFNPSEDDNFVIKSVSEGGHLEIVKLLLSDERVDPSAGENYAIRWASRNGHHEVVNILLKHTRVNPSTRENYAIRLASERGHVEVVKLLLADPRVDPSDDENYAIRLASEKGHVEVVKLLLADPRVADVIFNIQI